jgi:hypothetical protein
LVTTLAAPGSPSDSGLGGELEGPADPVAAGHRLEVDGQRSRQARQQQVQLVVAAQEAADDPRACAIAAVHDLRHARGAHGRSGQLIDPHRRPAVGAAEHMQVVVRHHHHLAGGEVLERGAVHRQPHHALDDVVEADHLRRRRHERAAELRRHPARHGPGGGELGLHEDAAGQADNPQNVRQRIHRRIPAIRGGPVKRSGGAAIQRYAAAA